MIARVFRELANVIRVVAADIHIEKDDVAIHILLAQDVLQIFLCRNKSFGQAGFEVPGIERKVENGNARVAEAIRYLWPQRAAIRGDINPETLFRRIINDLVHKIRPQKRFSTHQCKHAASVVVQPVNGTPGHVFRNAFDFIVIGPALPAVEIAFVCDKQVRGDRMKLARQKARTHVRGEPPAGIAVITLSAPVALLRWILRPGVSQAVRELRKQRLWQGHARRFGGRRRRLGGIHQQIVNRNVDAELCSSGH